MIPSLLAKLGIVAPHSSARRLMFIHDISALIFLVLGIILILLFFKIRKKKVKTTSIIIFIFLVIICAPLFQQYTHLFQFIPVIENRYRVPPPKEYIFPSLLMRKNEFAKNFEKYFNDNFGFRDVLIRIKNQVDYSLFRYSDEVLIGNNNWLFYKEEVERDEVRLEKMDDKHFISIKDKILALNAELKSKGITLVIMPIPEKNSIYPELNTQNTAKLPPVTRLNAFLTFFKSHPEVNVIDVPEILLSNKNKYPLYLKTDFHWNDIGAFLVSQKTIELLARQTNIPIEWKYPFVVNYNANFSGGQNNSLAIFFPTLESEPTTDSVKQFAANSLPVPKFLDYHFKSSFGDSQVLLPKTVLLGNSFSLNFIHTGFFDHFSEIYYLRNYNMRDIYKYIPEGTQIVIWQIIEVNLLDENLL